MYHEEERNRGGKKERRRRKVSSGSSKGVEKGGCCFERLRWSQKASCNESTYLRVVGFRDSMHDDYQPHRPPMSLLLQHAARLVEWFIVFLPCPPPPPLPSSPPSKRHPSAKYTQNSRNLFGTTLAEVKSWSRRNECSIVNRVWERGGIIVARFSKIPPNRFE